MQESGDFGSKLAWRIAGVREYVYDTREVYVPWRWVTCASR